MSSLSDRLHTAKGPIVSDSKLSYWPLYKHMLIHSSVKEVIQHYHRVHGMDYMYSESDNAGAILFDCLIDGDFQIYFAFERA